MKAIPAMIMSVILAAGNVNAAQPKEELEVNAPSAIVMEADTGQIVYEKSPDEKLPPASVTKVMTLLLIFDTIQSGRIKLEDEVTVSEYAASMGGSQVFLEPGEVQTVDTMIKCIAVSSANDACVAMAEYISGNEEEFVNRMNERAKELGMENTTFKNCNGLDTEGHITTARDIALMSRELITQHPEIYRYTKIWMENITHTTKKGTSEFGLSNTNKLMRQYEYATGLKTGSTSKAKFCLSATARKNDVDMIAVVMAADDSKQRVKDAITLLNYGFGKCTKYVDEKPAKISPVKVIRGTEAHVEAEIKTPFSYVDVSGRNLTGMKKKIKWKKKIHAPVKKGEELGKMVYTLEGEEVGSVPVTAKKAVPEITYKSALFDAVESFLL